MSLRSFRSARNAFAKNLSAIMEKLNLTPATLSMKLNSAAENSGSVKSVLSAQDIRDYQNNNKIPSLYAFYKLTDYLHVSMDDIFDPKYDASTAVGRSFARVENAPKVKLPETIPGMSLENLLAFREHSQDDIIVPVQEAEVETLRESFKPIEVPADEVNTILTPVYETLEPAFQMPGVRVETVTTVTTPKYNAKFVSIILERTDSDEYNYRLAKAVLSSGLKLKDIAKAVNCSTRSLRDYMYYGVSVPEQIAKNLRVVLGLPNFKTMGLKFDAAKGRYVHA